MSVHKHRSANVILHIRRILTYRPLSCGTASHRVSNVDDGLSVRSATEKDIVGICRVNKEALGASDATDYLPGWLPKVLKDTNRVVYVAEREDRIVAFGMGICGVDCGRTMLAEAVRIAPDFRGRYVIGLVMGAVLSACVNRCLQYERVRGSSILVEFFDRNLDKVNMLAKRVYPEVLISADLLRQIPHTKLLFPVELRQLSINDFAHLLQDKISAKRIYPEGLISVGYNIFETHPSNVPFITYFHDNIIMNKDQRALSIGGRFPCNDGESWRYNFNYSGVVDLTTCVAHLVKHLMLYANENHEKDMYIFLSISKSFKNLFGKDTIVFALCDVLGVDRSRIKVHMQYQYEYV